jgi:hypothetical protein
MAVLNNELPNRAWQGLRNVLTPHPIDNPFNVPLENTPESPGRPKMWIIKGARRESFEVRCTFQDGSRKK